MSSEGALAKLVDGILAERGLDSLEERQGFGGFLETGIDNLDDAVGGYPKETITEIYSRPGCGKTSMLMWTAINMGYRTLYIDTENRVRMKLPENIVLVSENVVENVEGTVNDALDLRDSDGKPVFDLIVVDSVASMIPGKMLADEYAADMGLKARAMAKWMQRLPAHLRGSNCALVFTNQIRDTMNAFGVKTFTPGGHALTYACSLRLAMYSNSGDERKADGKKVGHDVRAVIEKNTTGPDKGEFKFRLMFTENGVEVDNSYKPKKVERGKKTVN